MDRYFDLPISEEINMEVLLAHARAYTSDMADFLIIHFEDITMSSMLGYLIIVWAARKIKWLVHICTLGLFPPGCITNSTIALGIVHVIRCHEHCLSNCANWYAAGHTFLDAIDARAPVTFSAFLLAIPDVLMSFVFAAMYTLRARSPGIAEILADPCVQTWLAHRSLSFGLLLVCVHM